MSIVRPFDRQPGRFAVGLALAALVLAACQASASPSNGNPSASTSASASASAPSVEPSPSASTAPPHWETLASMPISPEEPRAVAFANGDVLVVGNAQDAALWDAASGTWSEVAGFDKPRTHFALVRLLDDRAMVIGGMNDIDQSYLSALVLDPAAPDAGWVRIDDLLHTARTDPSAVVLPNGRVLVAGGYFRVAPEYGSLQSTGTVLASSGGGGPLADVTPPNVGAAMATAELFDPAAGQWTDTGHMHYARYGAPATLLADDRVLVTASRCSVEVTVNAQACTTAEIYDPVTGSFELAGSLPDMDWSGYDFPHEEDMVRQYPLGLTGSLMPLPDGGAALMGTTGGRKYGGYVIRSFRYDAANGSWRQIGDLYLSYWNPLTADEPIEFETADVMPRVAPMVALLPDGRVLVAGGDSEHPTTATAELYDPADDSWPALPSMPDARAAGAAVTLPDGSVLLLGGHRSEGADPTSSGPLAEVVRFVMGSE